MPLPWCKSYVVTHIVIEYWLIIMANSINEALHMCRLWSHVFTRQGGFNSDSSDI